MSQFDKRAILYRDGQAYLNLAAVVREQLKRVGVKTARISSECTYCLQDRYFSFRRDKPKHIETIVAYVGMT